MRHKIVFVLVLFLMLDALLLLASAPVAHAATLIVNTAADDGPGNCSTTCTLRDALAVASDGDTITFADSYTITLGSTLTLSKNLTIDGSGRTVGVSGNSATQVFTITTGVSVTLRSVTVADGSADLGAGVFNGGTLTVAGCSFVDNNAVGGAAIFNDSGAALTAKDSTFIGNLIVYWGGRSTYDAGAAIFSQGILTVTNSTFSGNIATGVANGGAIANYTDGVATITGSTFDTNQSSLGGGALLNSGGSVVVDTSSFTGNIAPAGYAGGGAIWNAGGTLTATNSFFSGNTSGAVGATYPGNGGAILNYGTLTVTGNTFDGNSTMGVGGAIAAESSLTFTKITNVANNTFRGNSATISGGAIYATANSAFVTLTVTNNTFSANTAPSGGVLYDEQVNDGNMLANLQNNILVKGATGSNCVSANSPTTNASNNLADDDSCGIGFTNSSSILLGTLGSYGGSTQTIPLLPGSAAINAGSSTYCPTYDQRGKSRVGTCDIGAFESQGFTLGSLTGTPQSAITNKTFATPLGLSVTANGAGEIVEGGVISFTAPTSGASIAETTPFTKTISASGTVSATVTANGTIGGPYNVTASTTGATDVTFVLTNSGATTTTVTSAPNASTYGQTVTFTATVTSTVGTPTGTVQLYDNGTALGAALTLSSGKAVTSTASLAAGTHPITATYSGDSTYSASTSSTYTQTIVNPSPTLTAISPSSTGIGAPGVTLTLTGTNFLTNSVVLWNNNARTTGFVSSTVLTATIPASDLTSQGTFTVTVSNPTPGGGTSGAQTFTVGQVNTSCALTSAPNPSMLGSTATFTATLTQLYAAARARAPQDVTPTGVVIFTIDDTINVTRTVGTSGVTTYATNGLGVGTHTVVATFSGDANLNGCTSNQINQIVNSPTPTITSISPTSASVNAASFTLTVTGTGFIAASAVQWYNGSVTTSLTTTYTNSSKLTAAVPTSLLSAAGSVSVTVSNQAAGGDLSNKAAFTILPTSSAVTLILTSSCNPCFPYQSVILTATITNTVSSTARASSSARAPTVTPTPLRRSSRDATPTATPNLVRRSPRDAVPTGTATFYDNGNPIIGCVNVALTSAGQAICVTELAGGKRTITAHYNGDGNFGAADGTLTVNINYMLLLPQVQKH